MGSSLSRQVHVALEAAGKLEGEGISTEILDLRTLMPLDKEGIYNSVKKTSKVIILYETPKTGGIGGEIAALISEDIFDYLDGPIIRIGSKDTPVPYSPHMEEFYLPKAEDVVTAAKKLIAY